MGAARGLVRGARSLKEATGARGVQRGSRIARFSSAQASAVRHGAWGIRAEEEVSPTLLGVLNSLLAHYWERTPSAVSVMEFLEASQVRCSPTTDARRSI